MDKNFKFYNENNDKLTLHNVNNVTYFTSPIYDEIPWINSGFSTRLGGVSEGVCTSMNFAYNQHDIPENVYKNYQLFCDATGINIEKIVTTKQVHSNTVVKLDENHIFRSVSEPGCDFPSVDGVITNIPDVTLFAFSADCSLIQLVDPVNKAIGLCHSGWRGTVGRISANAIQMMSDNYGSDPSDIIATIGPSICPECFEVEWDMIEEARKGFSEADYDKIYYQKNEKKYQFNLWEANRIVLMESGIKKDHIFMPNLCTKCNPDLLFSHRNMGLNRGTLIAFLGIK